MKYFLIFLFFFTVACASDSTIFPALPVSISASELKLPSPIDIAVDTANGQIIVVNSDANFAYDQGSLVTMSVSATNPGSPTLTVTSVLATPHFSGQIFFDGNSAFVAFREGTATNPDVGQLHRYAVTAGNLSDSASAVTDNNPFGIESDGSLIYVVSDEVINIFNNDLADIGTIDLGTAEAVGIADSDSLAAESIAIDVASDLGFVSNRLGKMFVINLATNEIIYTIDGPDNTRDVISDGNLIYAVDGNTPALWVFDPALVPLRSGEPELLDDSQILIAVLDLGSNPNGITIEPTTQRAFVANTTDKTISVIDLNLMSDIGRISLDDSDTGLDDVTSPFGMASGVFDGVPLVFVTNIDSNNIAVINANTLKVVKVL